MSLADIFAEDVFVAPTAQSRAVESAIGAVEICGGICVNIRVFARVLPIEGIDEIPVHNLPFSAPNIGMVRITDERSSFVDDAFEIGKGVVGRVGRRAGESGAAPPGMAAVGDFVPAVLLGEDGELSIRRDGDVDGRPRGWRRSGARFVSQVEGGSGDDDFRRRRRLGFGTTAVDFFREVPTYPADAAVVVDFVPAVLFADDFDDGVLCERANFIVLRAGSLAYVEPLARRHADFEQDGWLFGFGIGFWIGLGIGFGFGVGFFGFVRRILGADPSESGAIRDFEPSVFDFVVG